jgi:hypothetical protein
VHYAIAILYGNPQLNEPPEDAVSPPVERQHGPLNRLHYLGLIKVTGFYDG